MTLCPKMLLYTTVKILLLCLHFFRGFKVEHYLFFLQLSFIFLFTATPTDEIIKCMCSEHYPKEVFNRSINLNLAHVYKCLFTDSDFSQKFISMCKYKEFKSTEWKTNENGEETRKQENTLDLGAFGISKSFVDQVSEKERNIYIIFIY
jgi:hypothetical protein